MSSSSRKVLAPLPGITAVLAAGGVAALAFQLYRRPLETTNALLRLWMLLAGAREETCDLNGLPLHYYCAGRRGTPIVLIHGLGNSAEVWASMLPLLSKEYLVYALDLPGFGKTPLAPEGVSVRSHVLYLQRFLDAMGYPQVALVGNSLGGWIATHFTAQYPERVSHLYLLNSAGLRREQMNSPYAVDRAAAQRAMKHIWGYEMPLPSFVLDAVVRISQLPAYVNFIKGYDPEEELDAVLAQVQVPTTIIWGTRDGLFPPIFAHEFHTRIANAELVLLEGVGHMPQMQVPAKVARIIFAADKARTE
jgi:pimeloyl-ACP methyl ester carboxylesterase